MAYSYSISGNEVPVMEYAVRSQSYEQPASKTGADGLLGRKALNAG